MRTLEQITRELEHLRLMHVALRRRGEAAATLFVEVDAQPVRTPHRLATMAFLNMCVEADTLNMKHFEAGIKALEREAQDVKALDEMKAKAKATLDVYLKAANPDVPWAPYSNAQSFLRTKIRRLDDLQIGDKIGEVTLYRRDEPGTEFRFQTPEGGVMVLDRQSVGDILLTHGDLVWRTVDSGEGTSSVTIDQGKPPEKRRTRGVEVRNVSDIRVGDEIGLATVIGISGGGKALVQYRQGTKCELSNETMLALLAANGHKVWRGVETEPAPETALNDEAPMTDRERLEWAISCIRECVASHDDIQVHGGLPLKIIRTFADQYFTYLEAKGTRPFKTSAGVIEAARKHWGLAPGTMGVCGTGTFEGENIVRIDSMVRIDFDSGRAFAEGAKVGVVLVGL